MNCLHCNKPIEGKRNTKKYCSNTCKQYAYLNRSFAFPTNPISVSLAESKNQTEEQNNKALFVESNNENKNVTTDDVEDNQRLSIIPIASNEYKQQNKEEEEEYQYITSELIEKIQTSYYSSSIGKVYFTSNTNKGGRFTEQNIAAFSYTVPRFRCIIENLFLLSYKKKVYYKTIKTIAFAVKEILFSEHLKALPNDFPFFNDLIKLYDQFMPLTKVLEDDKEGIKFTLNKIAIMRYILILNLIRDCTKKEPFHKLFPELYKTKSL